MNTDRPDDLARILERAGNAGDLEAEALSILAREVRAFKALLTDVAHDLTPLVESAKAPRPAELVVGEFPVPASPEDVAALRDEVRSLRALLPIPGALAEIVRAAVRDAMPDKRGKKD